MDESEYIGKERIQMEIGATVLPHFPKDTTDRNRTSPFAFTGNKFEFRMLGSTFSISGPNIVLNSAVAEVLSGFADTLEAQPDFDKALPALIKETIRNHNRIIFNGNNYSQEWVDEAKKRGLLNLMTTVDALPTYVLQKNIDLFVKHGVFTKTEVESRYEIMLESYCKTMHIEALTMIDMVKKEIMASSFAYQNEIMQLLCGKKDVGIDANVEEKLTKKLSHLTEELANSVESLETAVVTAKTIEDSLELAKYYRGTIFANMNKLRMTVDELETCIAKKYWAFPSYAELLYSVN